MKECERKAINFIEINTSAPQNKTSQIEYTLFIKPTGYSGKWAKAHYEINNCSEKKQKRTRNFEVRIVDSQSFKQKVRTSKDSIVLTM